MQEWGVDDRLHSAFWDAHIDFVRNAGTPSEQAIRRLGVDFPEILPEDFHEAVAEVVRQELCSVNLEEGFWRITDATKEAFPDELCHSLPGFAYDREARSYTMHRRFAELGIDAIDLNPFTRFSYERVPAVPELRKQYTELGERGYMGAIFRGIVAHATCQGAKCGNCHAESVRWNGYESQDVSFRYWNKLVCEDCGSYYDIKCGATEESIGANLCKKKYLPGGYLDSFYAAQNRMLPGAKQYLALFCFETCNVGGQRMWPVYVGEIASVSLCLKDKSFRESANNPKVFTKIDIKPGWDLWFQAPHFELDAEQIVLGVLDTLSADGES